MKTAIDCIPCFLSQSIEAARMATTDESQHLQVAIEVMQLLQNIDFSKSPPMISQYVHKIIRQVTGSDDPYKSVKHHANLLAKNNIPL